MKISGHKNEKDFYRYIRAKAEEAAQKLIELWQERNELEIFKSVYALIAIIKSLDVPKRYSLVQKERRAV